MNLRRRLDRLECAADNAAAHTCGPIVIVGFDEEPPPPRPPCKACELEFRRTGRRHPRYNIVGSPVGRRVKGSHILPYPVGEPLLLNAATLS
jgi:hypothetical protein